MAISRFGLTSTSAIQLFCCGGITRTGIRVFREKDLCLAMNRYGYAEAAQTREQAGTTGVNNLPNRDGLAQVLADLLTKD